MYRTVHLQTVATSAKRVVLSKFLVEATNCANWMISKKTDSSPRTLWSAVGRLTKDSTGFNVQVVCDLVRLVAKSGSKSFRGITVKFYLKRNCKTFRTSSFFFVDLGLYPGKRVAVPVKRNRSLDRYFGLLGNGWTCKTYGLTPNLEIIAYLIKEKSESFRRRNVLGIDINAKRLAVSVLSPSGVILCQTYFGKHIWVMRKRIMKRRALLQSMGSNRKLKALRNRESNFVKTNLGQLVREIIGIANRFDADIAIEWLRKFRSKGKRFNRDVMKIPFRALRGILEARCFDKGIKLYIVNPWHTSKWCIRCGAVNAGHSANYSLYRCKNCGLVMDADRKASVAIAAKSLLERDGPPKVESLQISGRRVPVMALVRSPNEAPANPMAVPLLSVADGSSQTSK